jgi:hypothetical protein
MLLRSMLAGRRSMLLRPSLPRCMLPALLSCACRRLPSTASSKAWFVRLACAARTAISSPVLAGPRPGAWCPAHPPAAAWHFFQVTLEVSRQPGGGDPSKACIKGIKGIKGGSIKGDAAGCTFVQGSKADQSEAERDLLLSWAKARHSVHRPASLVSCCHSSFSCYVNAVWALGLIGHPRAASSAAEPTRKRGIRTSSGPSRTHTTVACIALKRG